MSSKTIPADERVQVLTQEMLERDSLTIRNEEDGADVRMFASEDDEGEGIPLRTDDEVPIFEEEGWGSLENSDGLWMETAASTPTEITVLKGIALERNVRRTFERPTDAAARNGDVDYGGVSTDGLASGGGQDNADIFTNNTSRTMFVELVNTNAEQEIDDPQAVITSVNILDDVAAIDLSYTFSLADGPAEFNPGFPLKPGYKLNVNWYNYQSAQSVDLATSAYWRVQ